MAGARADERQGAGLARAYSGLALDGRELPAGARAILRAAEADLGCEPRRALAGAAAASVRRGERRRGRRGRAGPPRTAQEGRDPRLRAQILRQVRTAFGQRADRAAGVRPPAL